MVKLCFDETYVIQYTDSSKGTISIPRKGFITDEVDITLVGKDRVEYGQEFDENMLHLLERFSCPEVIGSSPVVPDTSYTEETILENPIEGQIWFNSTKERPFVYDGTKWKPFALNDDVGGNRGVIFSGMSLPKPVSPITGIEFDYPECSWNVSPFNLPGEVDFMECYTDSNAVVNMRYRLTGGSTIYDGYANYQIIGIRDNSNQGDSSPVLPSGTQLPTPTPTPTPSVTSSVPLTPTVTPTVTPTPNPTPTVTPTPAVSSGIEFFVSVATDAGYTTESVKFGQITPSGFSVLADNSSELPIASLIYGSISSDGYNLFIPYLLEGTAIYTREGSVLSRALILENETSGFGDYVTADALYHNHPTVGKLLYTLQLKINSGEDPATISAKIRTYVVNSPGSLSLLTTTSFGFSIVSTANQRMSLCLHNNYLIVTNNEKIFAFYHNGSSLNQITSLANITGNYIRARSDNSFIYLESRYDNTSSKPDRKIYTFSGSTFTEALSQAGGEYGLAVGGSNVFSGFNNESSIQAKYWDGFNLTSSINSVPSAEPAYGGSSLFKFSNSTNRLYNPVDNSATLSKVYTWNGTTFTPIFTFNIEDVSSDNKYVAFDLIYLKNSSDYI